jgi:hypothetical protein
MLKSPPPRASVHLSAPDDQYIEAFHGYEYRLGPIQERRAGTGLGYRALSGEYVGEPGWTWGEVDRPFAEVSFFEAADRSRNWPWYDFLDLDGEHLEEVLQQHWDVLRRLNRYGQAQSRIRAPDLLDTMTPRPVVEPVQAHSSSKRPEQG